MTVSGRFGIVDRRQPGTSAAAPIDTVVTPEARKMAVAHLQSWIMEVRIESHREAMCGSMAPHWTTRVTHHLPSNAHSMKVFRKRDVASISIRPGLRLPHTKYHYNVVIAL